MKIFGMGMPELILILVVVLIIFGPKNLPNSAACLAAASRRSADAWKTTTSTLLRENKPHNDPRPTPRPVSHAVHRKPLEETGAFSYGEGSCMANRRFAPSNRPSRTNARTLASR